MRESFAIGPCGPCDGSRLTATSYQLPATSHPFSRPASKTSNITPIPSKRHPNPTRKACCARRAKRPRQGWRGRSARMRESFAIGHSRPFGGSRLTATSHFPDLPLTPQTTRPSPQSDTQIQQERPAMPEEQSVHARDGVADPHGCGNPLRSGIAGLSTAPDSQPPATHFPDPPLRPQTPRPSPQSDIQIPTRKACCARRAKRPRQGWRGRSAWMRESFAIGHSRPFGGSRLTAISFQLPATRHKLSAPCNLPITHKKKRQAGFPLTCRFCNEPQLTPDKLLFVFSRVVFVFCIRFRRNLFIVNLCFRRDIFLAFRHATVD